MFDFAKQIKENSARHANLISAASFEKIIDAVTADTNWAQICFNIDHPTGKAQTEFGDKARRAIFKIPLPESVCDLFFNSSQGYRAQYAKGIRDGNDANEKIIEALLNDLDRSIDKTLCEFHRIDKETVKEAIRDEQSKIWIYQRGLSEPRFFSNTKNDSNMTFWKASAVNPEIIHPVWNQRAKANLSNIAEIDDEGFVMPELRKAIWGGLAPTARALEIKTPWILEGKKFDVTNDKKNRSRDIYENGYS